MNSVLLFNVNHVLNQFPNESSDFLGLFYLAAVLEDSGYDPWVFHGNAHEVPNILIQESSRRNIVAIGFACDFENHSVVEELSLFVKENYGYPVIVGGPQAIALKGDFFKKSQCDYVVRGEAELTLPLIMDVITRHKDDQERKNIAGVTWKDDMGNIIVNPDNMPILDLDALPLPAYHRSLHTNRTYGRNIFTGRGCPFSCAFCYESNHKKYVRLRNMDKVIEEIQRNLRLYPNLNYIIVSDDTFTLNLERVKAFCDAINCLRRERNFVWYCEGHIGLLAKWPEMMRLMAESGLVRLQVGIETGCQNILDIYDKHVTIQEIEYVVKEAVKAGIPQIATNFIIGGPMESEETIKETKFFVERLLRIAPGVIDIITGFLRPYPGTAITNNPEGFQLSIIDTQGLKSFDDYPLIIVDDKLPEDILKYRVCVSRHIISVMNDIMEKGEVPYETILSQYRNALKYNITSMWYLEVFKKNIFLNEYFRLIVKGAAVRFDDVPNSELMKWRPHRTVEIWQAVNFEEGYPKIGEYVLSPLEFELLLRCSAKLCFEEVLNELYEIFGELFETPNDFQDSIIGIIKNFDDMFWVVFCKI